MARKSDIPGRIISATLELAAADGWSAFSMADIAARAGISLAALQGAFPAKVFIVTGFLQRIDDKVLADIADGDGGEPVHDRLFDILMARFDALNPHKAALAAILRGVATDPGAGLILVPRFMHSMAWMLEAAGLSSGGLAGLVRTQGLAMIYLNALRVWLYDDTEDMARTMAALDKGLRRAGRLVGMCCSERPPEGGEKAPPATG